jgi:hypothetical protein
MLSPDILHQLIKGSFKDHIVTWVNDYIKAEYPDKQAKKIMDDIDLRYAYIFYYFVFTSLFITITVYPLHPPLLVCGASHREGALFNGPAMTQKH